MQHHHPTASAPARAPAPAVRPVPARAGSVTRLAAAGNRALARLVVQRTVASDLAEANANMAWVNNELVPITASFGLVHGAIGTAAASQDQTDAAAGLKDYMLKFIDQIEGKKAELYEAERLAGKGGAKKRLPILSANDKTQPDLRYHNAAGQGIAKEVKAISSAAVGTVNQQIGKAYNQLFKRGADLRKIYVRIENPNNLWPGILVNPSIVNDAELRRAVRDHLPNLPGITSIQIEGINTPYGQKAIFARLNQNGSVYMNAIDIA